MATSKSGSSRTSGTSNKQSNAEATEVTATEAPTDGLTDAQQRADAERREWEQRMEGEAQEAEQQRDSAPRVV